jgi:hypothetical protein
MAGGTANRFSGPEVIRSGGSAPRITDEQWEKFKPAIIEKYRTGTLVDVMTGMEREHNFRPTCVAANAFSRLLGHALPRH